MQKIKEKNILCDEEPAYERKARYAQRERDIGTKRRYIPIATVTKDNNLY